MSVSTRTHEREAPGTSVFSSGLAAALLFSVALLAPLLWPLSSLAAFPISLQRLRRGLFAGISAAILAALLVAGASSAGPALSFLALSAMPGLLIGGGVARGRGLVHGCRAAFLWLSAVVSLALLISGPEIAREVARPLEQFRSREFLEGMRSSGMPPERVDDMAEQFRVLHDAIKVVYPAALLIGGALIVLANAALLRAYLVRRDPGWLDGGEFETLRWPLAFAAGFVLAGVSVAVPPLQPLGYNLLLLVAFFFSLQGLAVVAYYAHRLAGPPLLRMAVVMLVLANPWAPQILSLLGLFDTWFDFRKWADPPQPA
jgi:uncharacterized protein YybS (DUF2232 family)